MKKYIKEYYEEGRKEWMKYLKEIIHKFILERWEG